jgi:hypothetical protein
MTCPKCEEGTIKKITFKKSGEDALFCNACETVWLANENILSNSGHLLDALTKDGDMEYTFTLDEKSDDIPVMEDEIDREDDEKIMNS